MTAKACKDVSHHPQIHSAKEEEEKEGVKKVGEFARYFLYGENIVVKLTAKLRGDLPHRNYLRHTEIVIEISAQKKQC